MATAIIFSTMLSIGALIVTEMVVWKRDLKPWIDELLVEPVDQKLGSWTRVDGLLGDRRRRFSEALVAIFLGTILNVILGIVQIIIWALYNKH
ncbi:hypothetical protein LTR97_005265 [Elasticomyces elasticus]|uniref:Uncharacterized protein n=1 Tax=Elasticomyces elasticus TaxID=574655 RepID=A0AAN7W813_9PEZI|nr:hypothetical protein LTR97_005265 [Elasticomyces elasticus]